MEFNLIPINGPKKMGFTGVKFHHSNRSCHWPCWCWCCWAGIFNPWNPQNFCTFSCAPLKSSVERASSTKLTSSFSRRCRRWLRLFRGGFPPLASAVVSKWRKGHKWRLTSHEPGQKKMIYISRSIVPGWFVGISPEWAGYNIHMVILTRKGSITTYMTQRTGGGSSLMCLSLQN